jgi:hypothetical protein
MSDKHLRSYSGTCLEASVANRRNTRGADQDGRKLSFVVREPEARIESAKLALLIPPPRDPVSAVRRLDLAARLAMDLGELAAELVTQGKLTIESGGARTKERTR